MSTAELLDTYIEDNYYPELIDITAEGDLRKLVLPDRIVMLSVCNGSVREKIRKRRGIEFSDNPVGIKNNIVNMSNGTVYSSDGGDETESNRDDLPGQMTIEEILSPEISIKAEEQCEWLSEGDVVYSRYAPDHTYTVGSVNGNVVHCISRQSGSVVLAVADLVKYEAASPEKDAATGEQDI